MVFRKKNEEEEKKELTMQEAIVTMGKTIANINSRLDKQEQKPQEQHKEVEQPVQQVKKAVERFVVYDQPIEHKRHILDNTDPENPVVYDIETALVKILNDVEHLKKALG